MLETPPFMKAQMAARDAELRRMNSVKQRVLARWPKPAIYARYLKSVFRGEIELRLLPWLCDRHRMSFDVGAHHGIYALGTSLFSKNVVAVEPQADRAGALRQALPRGASLVEGALSNRSGSATINIPVGDWDSTARLELGEGTGSGPQWRGQRVDLMRLDDLADGPVGFIKIDVEGHELEVLDGAQGTIATDRPALLIEVEERHRAGSVDAVADLLLNCGYEGYFVYRGAVRPIREFSTAIHQAPSLIGSGDRSSYSDYINNFIFVPKGFAMPRKVPSAWRALARSVQRAIARA